MKIENEGVCRFCLKTFSGSGMSRHLSSCKIKKEMDLQKTIKGKTKSDIFYIQVKGHKPYWLHLEMKGDKQLSHLDSFLRNIWLECCGHLSAFTCFGIRYESNPVEEAWECEPVKSMNISLKELFTAGNGFEYEYDYGSTTYLSGKIVGVRSGVLKENVKILARNNPPKYDCSVCNREASDYCVECEDFYCKECLNDHECEEEMSLPVVNSPRMGVCGYTGNFDTDKFRIP